ncbi:MAG: ribokinase [Christensenellales bacterium]|jgi:ribokinase|nr:ribokinase [Christensenellaceae bacterium]
MSDIQVIGSLNVDMTVRLSRFHAAGETITGEDFNTYLGGKGGNQAMALSRLGASVSFIGMVGEDSNGARYIEALNLAGVDTSGIGTTTEAPTGVALIEVNKRGENRIAVVPGANALCDVDFLSEQQEKQEAPKLLMLQLEIPLYSCMQAAKQAEKQGTIVMLDPAPAVPLNDMFLSSLDWITPNESELRLLTGMPIGSISDVENAAKYLLSKGAKKVVAKLGKSGCLYVDSERSLYSPTFSVNAVDTTAAGDSFNAGLAYAIINDMPLEKALRFANAVGAISTTMEGAQAAMPTLEMVEEFLANNSQIS